MITLTDAEREALADACEGIPPGLHAMKVADSLVVAVEGIIATRTDVARLEPTTDATPPGGLDWRDGLDALDRLLNDCAQHGVDHKAFVRVGAVRDIVNAVRRYEDDTDESIRSAQWEDAMVHGEPWAMGVDDQ